MKKRLSFFATRADMLLVLEEFETREAIYYVTMNMPHKSISAEWSHGIEIEGLGMAEGEQTALCRAFLVRHRDMPLLVNDFEQFDGAMRYDINQMLNPDSIVLTPGGEWKREILIAGLCSTNSSSMHSQKLMGSFSNSLRKHFTRVNAYWVGPDALLRLRRGLRLTAAEQSPPMYDLRE